MYTPLEEAKEEVWKRWHDVDLRRRVAKYVGEVPEALRRNPRAVMFRQVVSPNFEAYEFDSSSKAVGLRPHCLEYYADRFCTRNPDKVLLGKMVLMNGIGRNGGQKISNNSIIDFKRNDMRCFHEIKTNWGEAFVAFHHRLMARCLPEIDFGDNTTWFTKMGGDPTAYYDEFLALFICHGVLFENFLTEGDEGRFTRDIVWPAIDQVTEYFGLKPLIVRLCPEESENDPYWCWYPGELEAEVSRLLGDAEAASKQPDPRGSLQWK